MAEIYIAFVDTPGIFAGMIRKKLKQRYVHVVLSLDSELNEAYSVGRRWPSIPLIAGFEREDKAGILMTFPTAFYMICRVRCTDEQKDSIRAILEQMYNKRFYYHYAVLSLPFIIRNRPFYQKDHYTCSSLLAKIFEDTGIYSFHRHFSLITPKDFYELADKQMIFEGSLKELVEEDYQLSSCGAVYGQ